MGLVAVGDVVDGPDLVDVVVGALQALVVTVFSFQASLLSSILTYLLFNLFSRVYSNSLDLQALPLYSLQLTAWMFRSDNF